MIGNHHVVIHFHHFQYHLLDAVYHVFLLFHPFLHLQSLLLVGVQLVVIHSHHLPHLQYHAILVGVHPVVLFFHPLLHQNELHLFS